MAKETNVELFIGVDHTYQFPILNEAETAAVDASSWSMSWMLKKSKGHSDLEAKVTKTTGGSGITVTGVYNPTPGSNTQRVEVALLDTDTDPLTAGVYYYELKRTNANFEQVLAYGEFALVRGVHRT